MEVNIFKTVYFVVHLFCFSIFGPFVNTKPQFKFKLNTEDYQHCVHHMVGSTDLFSADIIEHIIVNNPQTTLWSLQGLMESLGIPDDYVELLPICSVNIFIDEGGCPGGPAVTRYISDNFLNSRLRPVLDIFIVINSINRESCKANWKGVKDFFSFEAIDIFYMTIHPETGKLNTLQLFCSSCPVELIRTQMLNMNYQLNLTEMKAFANSVRTKSLLPIIATYSLRETSYSKINPCYFMYSKIQNVSPEKTLCSSSRIFIELAAFKLNMSVKYIIPRGLQKTITEELERHSGLAILRYLQWRHLKTFIQVLVFTNDRKFIYGTESDERESFNILFWTIPFDNYSWLLLGISMVSLSVCLKYQWLHVIAISMRQGIDRKSWNASLQIFTFMIIVVACSYESIISSYIIVPPPLVTFKTLKALVDNGYKIYAADGEYNLNELNVIFDRENITSHNITSTLAPDIGNDDMQSMSYCNITAMSSSRLLFQSTQLIVKEEYNPRAKIHVVTDTVVIKHIEINSFFGRCNAQLALTQRQMSEAGLMDFFRQYTYFGVVSKHEKAKLEEQKPKPLKLADWKITSIFSIWGFLQLVALVVIVAETGYNFMCIWSFGCALRGYLRYHS